MKKQIKVLSIIFLGWIAINVCVIFVLSLKFERHIISGLSCNYDLRGMDVNVIACLNSDIQQEMWYTLSDKDYIMEFPGDTQIVSLLLQLNPLEEGDKTGVLLCGGFSWVLENGEIIYQSNIQQLKRISENSQTYNGDVCWNSEEGKIFYQYSFSDASRIYFDSTIIREMDIYARENLKQYNCKCYINMLLKYCGVSVFFLCAGIAIYCLRVKIFNNLKKILAIAGVVVLICLFLQTFIDISSICIVYEIDQLPEKTIIIYTTTNSEEIWNEVTLIRDYSTQLKLAVDEIDLSKNILIEFRDPNFSKTLFKIKEINIGTKNGELYSFSSENMHSLYESLYDLDGVKVLPMDGNSICFEINKSNARVVLPAMQNFINSDILKLNERKIRLRMLQQRGMIMLTVGLLCLAINNFYKNNNNLEKEK